MELLFKHNQEKNTAVCCGLDDKDYDGKIVIPGEHDGAAVVAIYPSAFCKSKLAAVHIPDTVKSIGVQAFAFCDNLEQVTFEQDSCLEIIDAMAFTGCPKLSYIRLPDGIKVVERLAFRGCTCEISNRCLVMFPNFENCEVHTYEPDLAPLAPIEQDEFGNRFRLNETKDGYIAESISARSNIIDVPKTFNELPVTELGDMAFAGNDQAWKTVIPASVIKAGYFPYYDCEDMLRAEYGGTVEQWNSMDVYTWFPVHCKDGTVTG